MAESGTPLELLINNFENNKIYKEDNLKINKESFFAQMVMHTGS